MRDDTRNKLILGVIAIVIIAIILINLNKTPFTIALQGVKVIGLSSIHIATNPTVNGAALPGTWWIATVILGGLQGINVQTGNLTQGSNYLCNSACQNQNIQFTSTYNKIQYPVTAQGTPLVQYSIAPYTNSVGQPVTLTYQTCYGAITTTQTTGPSNQYISFSGCTNYVAAVVATSSFISACDSSGGVGLSTQASSVSGYAYDGVGCYKLIGRTLGYIYNINDPGQVNNSARITWNGKIETVASNHVYNSSVANMTLYYLGYYPGSLNSGVPVAGGTSGAVLLVATNQTLANGLHVANNTAVLEGTVLQSQVSSLITAIQSQFPNQASYGNALSFLSLYNSQELGLFYNDTVNNAFKGASFVGQQTPNVGTSGITSIPTFVIINDPNYQYAVPSVQVTIQAASLGLYLGNSTFAITSVSLAPFRSGSTGILTATIQNTGQAQGGYTLSVIPNSSTSSVTPASTTGSLNPAQPTSVQFTVGDNTQTIAQNGNVSRTWTVSVCNISNQCVTKTITIGVQNPCQQNQPYNSGTCAIQTSISTTTINNGGSSSTTTIPCNPAVSGCGIQPNSCPSGFFDLGIGLGCLPGYYYVIFAVIVIVIIYFALNKKKGGGSGVKLPTDRNAILIYLAIAVLLILIYTNYLVYAIIGAVLIGVIYIIIKILPVLV